MYTLNHNAAAVATNVISGHSTCKINKLVIMNY